MDLKETYNKVSANGKMLVSQRNETERFLIYKYNSFYYEFELILGECVKCAKQKQPFKYLEVLIKSKYNEVKIIDIL